MNLDEFRKELLENVAARATADKDFRHVAFLEQCARMLEDAGEVSDIQACYYRGVGSRKRNSGLDAYAPDEADGSWRFFIADFIAGEEPESLTHTDAKSWFSRLQTYIEDSLSSKFMSNGEESAPAYALAQLLARHRAQISRFRLYLLTDSVISSRIRDLPEDEIAGIPTDFHIWDVSRFFRVFESTAGRDELEVDFDALLPGGLDCIAASVDSNEYKAYLCVIRGDTLAAIYEKYGSRLLEGNVRSFLTTRGKVNKAIRATILNRPEMFFAFNNGIACTSSAAIVRPTREGAKLLGASDLQIVNGGQTTASVASALRNDRASLSSVFVPMKLSVIPAERAGEVIPEISRSANSQNKVSEADFFSNHEFHRRIEQISRRLWAPASGGAQYETHWFYERARGQYLNEQARLTPAERKRFVMLNPRQQVITKTDLAKFENSCREIPHTVSHGAQKNFLAFSEYASAEWDRNSDQFNDDYVRRLVGKALLFKATEAIVSEQPWYQGGYRANVVTYSIAKLVQSLRTRDSSRVFDFRQLWAQQSVPASLRSVMETIATKMFEVIVSPDAAVQNVTEWCKKELCWRRAEQVDLEIDITRKLRGLLIEKEQETELRRDSSRDRRIDDGIENQSYVFRLGPVYWTGARAWAKQQGIVTADEDGILAVAASMPKKMPSEKQSWRLIQIKAKLELEGFPKQDAEKQD
jgi:AIPR protein/abortive infection phage resistance-like protein